MMLLDFTLATPEENLALDEALLLALDAAAGREVLRFWESRSCFVTLGVAGKLLVDVDVDACEREGVPVLRRASGGGTVLQGPGCLNYTLVLSLAARPELLDLTRSYAAILSRVATALGIDGLVPCGTSDLAIAGRKVSGNAQKRTRHAVLHHGTVLHAFELSRIARLLREPDKQPDYRDRRRHGDFVANVQIPAADIKARIARAWNATAAADPFHVPDLTLLLREKYANREWTARF